MHLFETIKSEIRAIANHENALPMEAYMKHNFKFAGVNSPIRKALIKQILTTQKLLIEHHKELTQNLWDLPEREFQYVALDISVKLAKKMDDNWISFWEEKIVEKSWWDSVDCIAPNILGPILLKKNKTVRRAYAEKWMQSDNLWLNRSAIIFQLKYKKETDKDLLFDMVLAKCDSKEFFIRKACGWALREHSKLCPLDVSTFINNHQELLSALTIREASKYI